MTREPLQELVGTWTIAEDDGPGRAAFGVFAATFTAQGDLVYSVRSPQGLTRTVLTWRLEGEDLITDQPSHPREIRTPISFDDRGRLRLHDLGSACTLERDGHRPPLDPDAALFALGAAALRHGVSSAAPGGAFYSFIMAIRAGGERVLVRFVAETPEQSRDAALSWVAAERPVACAYIRDGFATRDGHRTDAVIAEVGQAGRDRSMLLVLPYEFAGETARAIGSIEVAADRHEAAWCRSEPVEEAKGGRTNPNPAPPPAPPDEPAAPRRPWVAFMLALSCNGLGHAYAGHLWTGVALHAGWLALVLATVAAMGRGLAALAIGLAAALVAWVGQAVQAARAARRTSPGPRRWSSRPLGLVALYAASLLPALALQALAPVFPTRPWYCPSVSMTPTLLQGDLFMAAMRDSVMTRGDVVVHQLPRGGDPGLKRVVGLPGDEVEVRNGHLVLNGTPVERRRLDEPCTYEARPAGQPWRSEPCVAFIETLDGRSYHVQCSSDRPCGDVAPMHVPTGHVVVLGDFRDHSADSRVYGPVPMSDVIGVARYIYFSFGPTGVRWERLGLRVE